MKLAEYISTLTNPPIICIPLFLIISVVLSGFSLGKFVVLEVISLIFASLLPMAIILYWARKLGTDKDISNRQDRFTPLIVGTLSYFIGFIVSLLVKADIFLSLLLLCYAINTFIVMLITIKWKVSIHTTGLSGPVCALIILLGPAGALLGLLYPLLIWSRVTLNKHTMAQAVTGGVQGFFLTALELYLFFRVFNINLSYVMPLADVLWFIFAIILTPMALGLLSYIDLTHSKAAFYIFAILSVLMFVIYAPGDASLIIILINITCILISYLSDHTFSWHKIIK